MSPVAILLLVAGALAVVFSLAYLLTKDKKISMGFERNMKDRDITKRLLRYARPYVKQFVVVLILLLLSVAYEIISPLILGRAEQMITEGFEMKDLLLIVALSAGLLVLSMVANGASGWLVGPSCHVRPGRPCPSSTLRFPSSVHPALTCRYALIEARSRERCPCPGTHLHTSGTS